MWAKKSLGQHFLVSVGAIERILSACRALRGAAAGVLEIGPGTGALTEGLADLGRPYYALEVDYALAVALQEHFPRLTILLADATHLDLADLSKKAGLSPWLVVGNLPYNVGTAILKNVLSSPVCVSAGVLMLQKEVAQKLCANPGEAGYGPLAAGAAPWWDREILMTVPPGAFRPQPKVTSAVCILQPRAGLEIPESQRRDYAALVARAFAHPRKTLASNLGGAGLSQRQIGARLASLGLASDVRPGRTPWQALVEFHKESERSKVKSQE